MEIHHHSLLRALFLFLLCCLLATTSTCTLKPLDRHGIQSFLANVKNLDFDWGSDHDVCSFRGILCKRERIISINLNKRGLTGYLGSARYLTALEVLSLEGNALYGRIPSISGLQNLTRLDLSGNSFTSFTHDFLRNLPSLEHLYLENLPLQPWTIPDSVAGCNYLQYLHASNSSITGGFPLALAHVTSLLELSLSGNQLSGVLPSWVGGFVSITWLDLAGQNMSGPVEVLSKLTNLEDLVLSENQFSGSIPDLSALKNLQLFWADSNLFSGLVPENMSSMAKMKSLNLANNFLQGPLPSFPNVSMALVDANSFCQDYPAPCSSQVNIFLNIAEGFNFPLELAESWVGNDPCNNWVGVSCSAHSVISLDLHEKGLTGMISSSVAKLAALQKLILSGNKLKGDIPSTLPEMPNILLLDLRNNILTGKIPVFKPSVNVLIDGNMFEPTPDGTGGSKQRKILIFASIPSSVVLLCIVVFIFYKVKSKPRAEYKLTGIQVADICTTNIIQLSVEEVLKATADFCHDHFLGEGGYGVVFKGNYNGKCVAMKRSHVDTDGVKGQQEFLAEINVLSHMQHRNVLKLLGFCIEGSMNVLMYEYMSKGTLSSNLFGDHVSTCLTLSQRVRIAFDIATGIQYLHNHADSVYVHLDLKSSNILLDDKLRAVVADFGLVRKISTTSTFTKTKGCRNIWVHVSRVFAVLTVFGMISLKADIYAFGAILLELISGKTVRDRSLPEGETLISIFAGQSVDQEILRDNMDISFVLSGGDFECLLQLANLAQQCVSRKPRKRPNIDHCVKTLGNLLPSWCAVVNDDDDQDTSELIQNWHGDCSISTNESRDLSLLPDTQPLSCELGPGILGNIFDGSQRPLKTIAIKSGDVGPCGVSVPTLNKDQLWEFHPNKLGVRDAIANGHLYADTELELEFQGIKKEFTMLHTWPLWTPRRVPSKLAADMPLLKGQLTMTLPDGREESVMKITAFVANTSNMPVAACEISINTGQTGSLKIVGSVSSRGEDLGDPVTSATLSIVQVFWELEKKLAQRKHFPSVNWLISHSKYPMAFESFYGKFNSDFIDTRTRAREVLQREDDLNETVQLVGKDALGEGDNITLETAKLLLEDYLVHNAFTLYDKYCPFYKSVWMMCNIIHFNTLANQAVERAANAGGEGHKITYSVVKSRMPDLFYRLLSQKYEDPAEGEDVLLVKFQKLYDDLTTGFRNLKDEAR